MPRPTPQTPVRHLLLQITLLGTLIATLALARVVTNYKLHALDIKLTPPVRFDDLAVSLPEDWTIQNPSRRNPAGPLVLKVSEPAEAQDRPGRILTVIRDHQDIPDPPLDYLLSNDIMPRAYAAPLGGSARPLQVASIPVGGHPGYLAACIRQVRLASGQLVPMKEIFVTATLPSRDVLTLRLEGLGTDLTQDLALIKLLAAGCSVPTPKLIPADSLTLPSGTTLDVPPGFIPYPEPDPHLTERHLLRTDLPLRWTRLTIVPCFFFPDDHEDSFRAMLTTRDSEWLESKITRLPTSRPATRNSERGTRNSTSHPTTGNWQLGTGNLPVFIADLPTHRGLGFPRRAYLLPWPTGHALMIELQVATPEDAADADSLVRDLAASATPPTGPAPTTLLASGAAEVKRLADHGLPSLLAGVPDDQWWLWTYRNLPAGYTHLRFSRGDPSHGLIDARTFPAPGVTTRTQYSFETSPDFSRHNDKTLFQEIYQTQPQPFDRFAQQSSVASGRYAVVLVPDPSTGQVQRAAHESPKAFLPGPWLGLLLPHLPQKELILRTSRLPGLEALSAPAPITVHLTPTTQPHTFNLDVSGTGQILTLSPTTFELSTLHKRRPTTPAELQKLFPTDPTLATTRPASKPRM